MTTGQVPAYSYTPGAWTVLVRGSILAALPAGTDPATIATTRTSSSPIRPRGMRSR